MPGKGPTFTRPPHRWIEYFLLSLQFVYTFVYNGHIDTIAISGFKWDHGNRVKCQKHGVSSETIETLFQRPLAVLPDEAHFALRRDKEATVIRPISARYIHKKKVNAFEKANPDL